MTTEDLKNVRRQKLRVETLQDRIARLRSRTEYTCRELGETSGGDPTRDQLAEYVAELDALERRLTGEMIALEKQLAAVDAELAKLPAPKETILRLRYCEGLKWEEVAKRANYCERHCRKIAAVKKKDV